MNEELGRSVWTASRCYSGRLILGSASKTSLQAEATLKTLTLDPDHLQYVGFFHEEISREMNEELRQSASARYRCYGGCVDLGSARKKRGGAQIDF